MHEQTWLGLGLGLVLGLGLGLGFGLELGFGLGLGLGFGLGLGLGLGLGRAWADPAPPAARPGRAWCHSARAARAVRGRPLLGQARP